MALRAHPGRIWAGPPGRMVAVALSALTGIGVVLCSGAWASARVQPTVSMSSDAPAVLSSRPPLGAISITPTDDAQKVVNDYKPGTSFVITAGVHAGFVVRPLPDDVFYAQPGAVLDGGHILPSAFTVRAPGVSGVHIIGDSAQQPLIIEHYGTVSHSQSAAVQTSPGGKAALSQSSGWVLQWVTVTDNLARGITTSSKLDVVQCDVIGNGRLGIGGGGAHITIVQTEISRNGVGVSQPGWEAGGIKTVGSDVLIAHDQLAGNGAPAIWTDAGANHVVVQSDTLRNNTYGVQVEISQNISIASNTISGSAMQAVVVIGSANVAVRGNTISNNFRGVIVGGVKRTGPGGIHLHHVVVSHNVISNSGSSGLHQVTPASAQISFDWDRYRNERFQWQGARVTFAQLQGLGQERHGSSTP